jgi:putative hydrolase of the HAD superfamily
MFDHTIACRRVAGQTGLREEEVREAIFTSGLQHRYEAGEVSSAEFVQAFVTQTGRCVNPDAFLRSCSDIFQLNAPIVPVVAQLRSAGYRLGLLSNTCQAHWEFVSQGRFAGLHCLFDVEILSFVVRALKPLPSIYEAAIRAADVAPDQIFFTDDLPENVAGARQAGLDATLFQDVPTLLQELRRRNIAMDL